MEDSFKHLEHIGIAVKDLQTSEALFTALLGISPYKTEDVASQNVRTLFYQSGQTKIELLEGLSQDDAISKFIEKKGPGIHHLAFEVDDIYKHIERLEKQGFTILNKVPQLGADNKLVAFLHPKSTNGVLIEICQEIKNK